jgi:hypothetical protein
LRVHSRPAGVPQARLSDEGKPLPSGAAIAAAALDWRLDLFFRRITKAFPHDWRDPQSGATPDAHARAMLTRVHHGRGLEGIQW